MTQSEWAREEYAAGRITLSFFSAFVAEALASGDPEVDPATAAAASLFCSESPAWSIGCASTR